MLILTLVSGACGGPAYKEGCVIRHYYEYVVFDSKSAAKISERKSAVDSIADSLGLIAIDALGLNLLSLRECKRTLIGTYSHSNSYLKRGSYVQLRDYYSDKKVFSGILSDKSVENFEESNVFDTCRIPHVSSISAKDVIREFVPEEPLRSDAIEGWWTTENQGIYIYLGLSEDESEYVGTLVYTSNLWQKRYTRIMSLRKAASDSLYLGSIWVDGMQYRTGFFLSNDLILTPRTQAEDELKDLSLIKLHTLDSNDDAWLEIEPLLRKSIYH